MSEPYIIQNSSVVLDLVSPSLGAGGFGVVRKGTYHVSPVAVKILKDQNLSEKQRGDFLHEARTNHALPRHPNILAFFGIVNALVMEFMPNGSLYDLIQSGKTLDWNKKRSVATDVACGMLCLHEAKVFHCDLKSPNVLIAGDKRLSGGSLLWKAPELLFTFYPKFTKECDGFSYAITLTELFTMAGPYGIGFQTVQVESLTRLIKSGERPVLKRHPERSFEFGQRLLAHDPKERPPFSDVVKRLDRRGAPAYPSARDAIRFTPPLLRSRPQNTMYHTPESQKGHLDSVSEPDILSSGRPSIVTHSTSDSTTLVQQFEELTMELRSLPKNIAKLEEKIDNETDPTEAKRLQARLDRWYAREEDLRAEKTRLAKQISRVSNHVPTTPTTPPPIPPP
ncbi:hypothetical protein HK104_008777 [Borealophlyctis nickersoniae]|nr:hypothetical protein HK104_008777 [Borealophlyctis nickersoniae]